MSDRAYDDFASIIPVVEGIDNGRVLGMVAAEFEHYKEPTPKNLVLHERARGHQTFVHVIHVADWLATAFGYGVTFSETPHATMRRDDIWCKLALEDADIALIQPRFFEQALEESALLGVLPQAETDPQQDPDQG
ncbi:MAG: hypothetical protein JRG95_03505 [Deltaproteobacteria bacterium]|nr:hypothetical protein [Deltaproteobacteria bacterium]